MNWLYSSNEKLHDDSTDDNVRGNGDYLVF